MANLNTKKIAEFEAKLNEITETIKQNHLEALSKISQITDASMMNSTKQEPSCTISFRGYSTGYPGPAGAGAVLCVDDGSLFCAFREGLGIQTKQVADYRALILGLKQAMMKGFKHVTVEQDSNHFIYQLGKPWQIMDLQLRTLCLEAMKLRRSFHSFSIHHVPTDDDNDNQAFVQAYRAINIGDGQVEEENLPDSSVPPATM